MFFIILILPCFLKKISSLPNDDRTTILIISLFITSSLVYVFFNSSRPLISKKILLDRENKYFFNYSELYEPYSRISEFLTKNNIRTLLIELNSNDWEYPLWQMNSKHMRSVIIHNYSCNSQFEFKRPHVEYLTFSTLLTTNQDRLSQLKSAAINAYHVYNKSNHPLLLIQLTKPLTIKELSDIFPPCKFIDSK